MGGACAEPTVVREAMNALRDGRPRLLGLVGEGGRGPSRTEGIVEYPMTCHSGGTLEIYVEPYLPKPLLVLVGHGPVIDALSTLGRGADYAVVVTTGGPAELEPLREAGLREVAFEEYKDGALPPDAGLQKQMGVLGVSAKQTAKARQAFPGRAGSIVNDRNPSE